MSDDKTFLARWSRRKREAALDTGEQPKPENAGGGAASSASAFFVAGRSSAAVRPREFAADRIRLSLDPTSALSLQPACPQI